MKEIVFYSEKTGEIREIVIRSEHTEASIQPAGDRENHWFVCYSQQFKSSWTDRLSGTIEDVKESVKKIIVGFDACFGCC
jgi:hypothetical protein